MAGKPIHRVTMFKIPKQEDQDIALAQYEILNQANKKQDGKPYILAMTAGKAMPEVRSEDYTIIIKSTFKSLDDLRYYDNECPIHKGLKATLKPMHQGSLTAYFEAFIDTKL